MATEEMALIKNGRWPDLKKRTALFSQYTVYWAAPYAAFF